MAQAPATPKLRRWGLSALGALSPRLGACLARTSSETAALALRAAKRPVRAAEQVTFLIPLVGAHHVTDWTAVTRRLHATLESLRNQTDPRWRAVICCQDRPPLPQDTRLHWLAFDDPTPGNDKWRKLRSLCAALPDMDLPPGYIMSFDADDLLHREAVAEMLTRQAPGGYLATQGFVMDHATGKVALARPQSLRAPGQKALWKLCGSCAALFHDPDQPQSAPFLGAMTAHEHRMFPHLAALAGRALTPLSKPMVLYVLNHGENFGARRGRVGFKTRFVARFATADPAHLRIIRDDFPAP